MSYLTPEYLSEERKPKQLDLAIAFCVLSTTTVILRVVSRKLIRAKIQWDDFLVLFAVVLNGGLLGANYSSTQHGSGRHVETISFSDIQPLMIIVYIGELSYPILLTAIKCSILYLYLRLFGINREFGRMVKTSMGLAISWGIAALFPVMFQCIPLYQIWNLLTPNRHCLLIKPYFLATNISGVFIDVLILILPMPQVWGLKMSSQRKAGITGVFILGAFTSIVGIIRLTVVARLTQKDLTWDYIPVLNWSTVEIHTGIICACLPVIVPATKLVFGRWSNNTTAKPSFVNVSTPGGASMFDSFSLSSLLAKDTDSPSTRPARDAV